MAIPTEKPSFGPLDGVKVVYAAVELACPKAADLMADWGADVIWLENTGAGDTIRDTANVKQAERRNQRSVSINYFSEEGKKAFFEIVKDADIFMEASKGGTWASRMTFCGSSTPRWSSSMSPVSARRAIPRWSSAPLTT